MLVVIDKKTVKYEYFSNEMITENQIFENKSNERIEANDAVKKIDDTYIS